MGNQEQKSNFWPIFIIVLAALTVGVWKLAPIVYSVVRRRREWKEQHTAELPDR